MSPQRSLAQLDRSLHLRRHLTLDTAKSRRCSLLQLSNSDGLHVPQVQYTRGDSGGGAKRPPHQAGVFSFRNPAASYSPRELPPKYHRR